MPAPITTMRFRLLSLSHVVAAAIAVLLCPRSARACSVCGSDDPLVATRSSAPNVGALRAALSVSAVTASARSDDDPAVTERLERWVLTPTLVYTPLPRLNLTADLPLQRNLYSATGSGVDSESHALWGLGDGQLGASYFVLSAVDFSAETRQELSLSAGSAFPTGRNGAQADGERLDEHAQLGRGAFGPYAGITYAFHHDPWNVIATVVGRTFTTNHHGYRYGSSLLWSAAVQYRPWDELAFELGTNDHYELHDTQDSDRQTNTGGLVLQASPGLLAQVAGSLWFSARVEIPVYTHLFGEQSLGPTYRMVFRYAF